MHALLLPLIHLLSLNPQNRTKGKGGYKEQKDEEKKKKSKRIHRWGIADPDARKGNEGRRKRRKRIRKEKREG